MPTCEFCGVETILHHGNRPVCTACCAHIEAGREPSVKAAAEVAGQWADFFKGAGRVAGNIRETCQRRVLRLQTKFFNRFRKAN